MEQHLGRKLSRKEHVHHIDGNRKNNLLSNLQVLSSTDHSRIHNCWDWHEGKLRKFCNVCDNPMEEDIANIARRPARCRSCQQKWRATRRKVSITIDVEVEALIGALRIHRACYAVINRLRKRALRYKSI